MFSIGAYDFGESDNRADYTTGEYYAGKWRGNRQLDAQQLYSVAIKRREYQRGDDLS